MLRVESSGSIWLLDEVNMTYRRMPKEEKPRDRPEWGSKDAGPLEDFIEHPFTQWSVLHFGGGWRIFIDLPEGGPVNAPISVEEANRLVDIKGQNPDP